MRLVYKETGKEVKVGDVWVKDGISYTVDSFEKPHKPASSGSVHLSYGQAQYCKYYVNIIGAEWIEREDRE